MQPAARQRAGLTRRAAGQDQSTNKRPPGQGQGTTQDRIRTGPGQYRQAGSPRMGFFFQELVNGITTGALYALVALGFSMVYGVLKLLNFAHGDLYMVGAFVGYFVIQWFGGPTGLKIPVPALLVIMFVLAAAIAGFLGVAIERFAYRPLRDAPRIAPLITAIGISFFLENAALLLFGAQFRVYNTPDFISFSSGFRVGSVRIDAVQIMVLLLGLVLMVGLRLLVVRTKLGKQMRAVASDREAAEMLGINVNFTIAATFFLGSALAGVAGVMAGLLFNQVTNTIGFVAGLRHSPPPLSAASARCQARCSAAC